MNIMRPIIFGKITLKLIKCKFIHPNNGTINIEQGSYFLNLNLGKALNSPFPFSQKWGGGENS